MANARFGQGTGPIFLSNLRCNGTEARLTDCSSFVGRQCNHREDAGVRCRSQSNGNEFCIADVIAGSYSLTYHWSDLIFSHRM